MDTQYDPDATYALGHSNQELERLIEQARLYEPFTADLFRDAGLASGMRVLDVGCGAGDVSILAARMVGPSGQVVGLDRSPIAVATSTWRAQELGLSNAHFLSGDASEITFEEPFDAVVGRLALMFSPDPVVTLRQLAAQARPGGIVVFHEPDWTGYRSLPALATWDRCARWIIESLQGSGADPYLGSKLAAIYTAAGLPVPALYLRALVAAGTDHPLYALAADLVRALAPELERLGITRADEVDAGTLATRLRDEVVAANAMVVWVSLIGAATRKAAS
jgi:SAM-dependent methyltransferase